MDSCYSFIHPDEEEILPSSIQLSLSSWISVDLFMGFLDGWIFVLYC